MDAARDAERSSSVLRAHASGGSVLGLIPVAGEEKLTEFEHILLCVICRDYLWTGLFTGAPLVQGESHPVQVKEFTRCIVSNPTHIQWTPAHILMTNLHESYVARLELEFVAPGSAVRRAGDCGIELGSLVVEVLNLILYIILHVAKTYDIGTIGTAMLY